MATTIEIYGAQGPRGRDGTNGTDAEVTAANVASAIGEMDSEQASGALDDLGGVSAAGGGITNRSSFREALGETSTSRWPAIEKIALVGDSITNVASTTTPTPDGGSTLLRGFGGWMRYALSGRVKFAKNTIAGDYDFGISGATTTDFISGGSEHATFEAALASDADTIIISLGANDCAQTDASKPVQAIIDNLESLYQEALATGKNLVVGEVFGCDINREITARSYYRRQQAVNEWIRRRALDLGLILLEFSTTNDLDGDGYADSALLTDLIHPNGAGAARHGIHAARKLLPFCSGSEVQFPASGSADWVTANPYGTGSPGTPATATSWTLQNFGNGTTTGNLIARTDGVTGNWQEVVIAGKTDAAMQLSIPTDYSRVWTRNSTFAMVAGQKYIAAAEIAFPEKNSLYAMELSLSMGGVKANDLLLDGSLAVQKSSVAPIGPGILHTFEFTASTTATADTFCFLVLVGNGRIRIGRFGVFKVS